MESVKHFLTCRTSMITIKHLRTLRLIFYFWESPYENQHDCILLNYWYNVMYIYFPYTPSQNKRRRVVYYADPLIGLPIISVALLVCSLVTVFKNQGRIIRNQKEIMKKKLLLLIILITLLCHGEIEFTKSMSFMMKVII